MLPKLRVLFLCTGNSCRSQMAEGWTRKLWSDQVEPASAGVDPAGVNPRAVQAMAESGVDISRQHTKHVDELADTRFDLVVTLCDSARERCALPPRAKQVIHVGFDDPPELAKQARSETEALEPYRRVRDEIRSFVGSLGTDLKKGERKMSDNEATKEQIREVVRDGYARVATGEARGACGTGCCGEDTSEQLAERIGYSEAELQELPDGANMGLSCGNPTALASLEPGEVVVDLGSGGGFDVFLAGPRVGSSGRAIGVDMTSEMVSKARRNLDVYRSRTGLANVEFRLGEIEHLPLADESADVIISNCVINLSPDKPQVWREIARVLRPGGRVAVSDLALLKPLPSKVREMVEALVGCVAGAVTLGETESMVAGAGLADIDIQVKPGYAEAMTEWNDPLYQKILEELPSGSRASDYIVSANVTAKKGATH